MWSHIQRSILSKRLNILLRHERHFSLKNNNILLQAKRLDGKVAIVTASTTGIGYAIAESMAENGASVVISSRKEDNVQKAVKSLAEKGLHVTGCVCHVGDKGDRESLIKTAIDSYGKLDVLVSNAGVNPVFGPMLQTSEEAWDKIFDLNVKASFLLAQAASPHIQETKGSMLFNSSTAGYVPFNMLGPYSVSKTALLGLVKVLSLECAPTGVRVNGIAPGLIKTDFSAMLTETEMSKIALKAIPMGRVASASEVAGTAVFLSSDEASYITGETIVIAGGSTTRL